MKLHCNIKVNNRLFTTNVIRRKSLRSIITIGRQTVKNTDIYLLWQTLQNKHGTKYKINNNVDKIYTKFINEGKATIRFIEPPHDLIIQSDKIQLKSFIHILKLAIIKKVDPSVLDISNLNPKCMSSVPKIKVVVNKSSEYPTLEGFPRTTEELYLVGLNRKSFDRQILRLQSLRILNLSNNQISSLPNELGTLQHLQELILSQNRLDKALKWVWLNQVAIRSNLKLLDISNNLLYKLPQQIGKLESLVNLKASQNMLSFLPQSLGKLHNLKYLDLSKNKLRYLPGSIRNLHLITVDVSSNEFSSVDYALYSKCKINVPSLTECAATSFLKTRCSYDASIIPFTLVKYLDEAKYCLCGNPCFHYYLRKFVSFDCNIATNIIKSTAYTGTDREVDYKGENFARFSGDTQRHSNAQLFAWEAHERGVDVHLLAEPTKLELLKQEYDKKRDELKDKARESIINKYGGKEHLDAPPPSLLLAQTEQYVEYSRYGKIIKGQDRQIIRSKYEEDVYPNNHTCVWGSYWHAGKWGYKCCHSFIKNSYCTGNAGKKTAEAAVIEIKKTVNEEEKSNEEIIHSSDEKSESNDTSSDEEEKVLRPIKSKSSKRKEKKQKQKEKRKNKKKAARLQEQDKLQEALQKEEERQKEAERLLQMNERKRPYNSMYEVKEPTMDEIEAFQMKRQREDDPMAEFLNK